MSTRGVIVGVARKAGLREDEAEVALQETMASVSRKIGDFEADPARGSFHGWLFKLAGWRTTLRCAPPYESALFQRPQARE